MSPILESFLRSAVAPAAVATVLFFLVGGMKDPLRARLQGLIFALAYMVGAYLIIGRLNFPPSDSAEGLSWGALLLAGFVMFSPRALGPRYVVRGLFVLALGLLILWPLRTQLSNPVYYRNLVAFFCLALGVWSISERASGRVRPVTMILLPLIAATALSLMMLFAASASLSQNVSVLCALLGGLMLLAWFFPLRVGLGGFLPFLSVFIIAMMVVAHFYLDVNPWTLIYLCIPFLLLWIREWFPFLGEKSEPIILGALAAAPLAYIVYTAGVKAGPLY